MDSKPNNAINSQENSANGNDVHEIVIDIPRYRSANSLYSVNSNRKLKDMVASKEDLQDIEILEHNLVIKLSIPCAGSSAKQDVNYKKKGSYESDLLIQSGKMKPLTPSDLKIEELNDLTEIKNECSKTNTENKVATFISESNNDESEIKEYPLKGLTECDKTTCEHRVAGFVSETKYNKQPKIEQNVSKDLNDITIDINETQAGKKVIIMHKNDQPEIEKKSVINAPIPTSVPKIRERPDKNRKKKSVTNLKMSGFAPGIDKKPSKVSNINTDSCFYNDDTNVASAPIPVVPDIKTIEPTKELPSSSLPKPEKSSIKTKEEEEQVKNRAEQKFQWEYKEPCVKPSPKPPKRNRPY